MLEVKRGIAVLQRKHILDLLQEIKMFGCKPSANLFVSHKANIVFAMNVVSQHKAFQGYELNLAIFKKKKKNSMLRLLFWEKHLSKD